MRQLIEWTVGLLPLLGAAGAIVGAVALMLEQGRPTEGEGRVGRVLDVALALSLIAIGVVTLAPVSVQEPADWVRWNLVPFADLLRSLGRSPSAVAADVAELLGNVALFMPFGAVVALRERDLGIAKFAAAAAFLSIAVELAQLVEAMGREADVTDVLTNTAGAVLAFGGVRMVTDRCAK